MIEFKIVFEPITGNGKSLTLILRDTFCIHYSNRFDSFQGLLTYADFTSAIVDFEGVIHYEHWKVSDINPLKIETKPETVLTPKISKITWIDRETKNQTEETTYGNKIALAVRIANPKSGTATIKIEKEDGSEFENGEKSFTYIESVDDDGIAEITSIEIKEKWEEFKTAEKDSLVATVEYLGATKQSKALQLKTFDVKIKLLKDHKTIVPMGIPAFSGAKENKFIEFEVNILEKDIDNFDLEILKDDEVIYMQSYGEQILEEVTVIGKASKNRKNQENAQNEQETQTQEEETAKKCKVGNYRFKWDGFIQGKYDSTLFLDGAFKARIKGYLNQAEKTAETKSFSFKRKEKDWVDVKIDETAKRIDVTLRVNLRDGGAKGTEKDCHAVGSGSYSSERTICPWGKIPKKVIKKYGKPIKTRTKTFEELREMALEGISTYWSRTLSRTKGTEIDGENYVINVNAIQDISGMKAPKIVFLTNNKPGRSRNWELSRILFYNIGYLLYEDGWGFYVENDEDYKMTSAHEIGHEILLSYGGHSYSKSHKDSSTILTQKDKDLQLPSQGEIDLMKYYEEYYEMFRTVASKKDALGLIWLTKIKLK